MGVAVGDCGGVGVVVSAFSLLPQTPYFVAEKKMERAAKAREITSGMANSASVIEARSTLFVALCCVSLLPCRNPCVVYIISLA